MRLRLTVQRNALPATNILWSVPETNSTQAYTVSRLLEDVNHIIPLEAEHWGLEHYVVEVGGFECLHFMPVANVLKEDDHVSIRPIMTAEVRARTLTGRDQISEAGQHLVDGIPFGRPYLRQPNRPPVRIPPRKRRRLGSGEVDTGAEAEDVALLMEHGENTGEQEEELLPLINGHTVSRSRANQSRGVAKTVQFQEPETDTSDDSEDDDDFAPEDGDGSASGESSEEDSDSDSDSSSAASSSASDTSDSDSDSESSDSDSDSDSDLSDASTPPDVLSSKDGSKATTTSTNSAKHVPPGQGLKATKIRNSRRTRVNRLRRLKAAGMLPESADLSDLKNYEEAKQCQSEEREQEEESISTQPFSKSQGKRKRLDEETSAEMDAEDAAELEQRRQQLMARFEDIRAPTAPSDEPVQPPTINTEHIETPPPTGTEDGGSAKKQAVSRRLRPDVGAIGRILARQAPPLVRKGKNKPVADEPPEPEGASDPDFWKSRINVSAFECWDEEFELSAPPFPFEQHWDPASKLMREKAAKKKQKKRSHAPQQTCSVEEEDEEEKIILDYDDAPAASNDSEVINAAIEDQLQQDLATAAQADLPPIPEDMSTLPDLTAQDMKVGAIIACKFFTVNPITVTPEISGYKTAIVEHEGDSGPGAGTIQLKIAARDLIKREKKFDSKGKRIYDAADALLMDDDEDEGLWEGHFGELLEAKLLKAA